MLPESAAALEDAKDADRGLFGEAATASATIDVELSGGGTGGGSAAAGGGAGAGAGAAAGADSAFEELAISPAPKTSMADFFSKFDKNFGAAKASAETQQQEDTSAITRHSPVYTQGSTSLMPHKSALTKAGKLAAEDNALDLIGDLILGPRLEQYVKNLPDAEDTRSLSSNNSLFNNSPAASTSSRNMSPSPSNSYSKLNPMYNASAANDLDKDVGVFEL